MKKSRKLAWVVLGVVGAGTVVFFAWLSTLYTPWEHVDRRAIVIARQRVPVITESCRQKFPWLPGMDLTYRFRRVTNP